MTEAAVGAATRGRGLGVGEIPEDVVGPGQGPEAEGTMADVRDPGLGPEVGEMTERKPKGKADPGLEAGEINVEAPAKINAEILESKAEVREGMIDVETKL